MNDKLRYIIPEWCSYIVGAFQKIVLRYQWINDILEINNSSF